MTVGASARQTWPRGAGRRGISLRGTLCLTLWGAGVQDPDLEDPRPGYPWRALPRVHWGLGKPDASWKAKNREWAGEGQRWPHPATEEQPVLPIFPTHFPSPYFFWIQYRRMDVLTASGRGEGKLYSSSLCLLNDLPCALFKWLFKGVNCKVTGVHNFGYLFILQ